MADCDDRQLSEEQRAQGYAQSRVGGVLQALRPFSGKLTLPNLADYLNRELVPALRQTRSRANDTYARVSQNAPSGNPLEFYFSPETAAADPTAGFIRLDGSPQSASTTLRISEQNARLADVVPWLDVMAGASTDPLGVITLSDAIDPSRFLRFDLDTMTDQGAYWDLGVTLIESSHDDPFVENQGVAIGFIPGVAAAGATVPPGSLSPIGANTIIGNPTASAAAPTEIALPTLSILGRRSGNITAIRADEFVPLLYPSTNYLVPQVSSASTTVFFGKLTTNSIVDVASGQFLIRAAPTTGPLLSRDLATLAGVGLSATLDPNYNLNLAQMAAGTYKGRLVGSGTGDPTDLTGAEATAGLRYAWIVDTASSGTVTSYAPTGFGVTTTGIRVSPPANLTLRGMALADGQQIAIRVGRGTAFSVTLNHEDASAASAAERFNCPGNTALTLRAGEACIIRYIESRCNVISAGRRADRLGAPVYDVVLDFGAAGNGVTDDTAALNAAIAAANAVPGDIYLGKAHLITAALDPITSNNIMIRGRGPFDNGSRIDVNAASAPASVLTFAGQYTGITDTWIRAVPDTYATGNAVHVSATYRAHVEHCRIQNFANGIEVSESTLTVIDNCELYNIREDYGIWVHGTTTFYSHATWISHVVCDEGIGSEVTWFLHDSHAHTLRLLDCAALNGGYGLRVVDTINPGVNPPHFTRAVNLELDHQKFGGVVLEGGEQAEFEQLFVTGMIGGNAAVAVEIKSTYSGDWRFDGGFIFAARAEGFKIAKGDGILSGVIVSACSLDASNTYDAIAVAAGVEDFTIIGCSTAPTYRSPGLSSRYDLSIGAGCDNYVVTGNRFDGSITGTILNTPGVASTRVVRSNIPDTATGFVPDGDYGDITVSSSGTVWNIDADTVGNTELANMAAGSFKGRAITAGTGDPQDLTGAQITGALRYAWIVDTASSGTVTSYAPTGFTAETTGIRVSPAGNLTLRGMALTDGHQLAIRVGRGTANTVTFNHEDGSANAGEAFNCPGNANLTLRAGEAVIIRYIESRCNIIATGRYSVSDGDYGDITVSSVGTVYTIDNNAVTDAKLRDSAALSVIGRGVNSSGDPGDLVASVNDRVLVRRSNALVFDQVVEQDIADGVVTMAKLAGIAANTIVGNPTAATFTPTPISIPTNTVLGRVAGNITAAQVVTGQIADANVTLAKIANIAESRILGRAEGAGSGVATELTPAQVVSIIDGESVTWTAAQNVNAVFTALDTAQMSSALYLTNIISPTVSSSQNDWAPTGHASASIIRVNTSTTTISITGISAPGGAKLLILINVGNQLLILPNGDGGSSAANQFAHAYDSPTLTTNDCAVCWYDTTSTRWRIIAGSFPGG